MKERGRMTINDIPCKLFGAALLMGSGLTSAPGLAAQTQVPLLNSLLTALANPSVAYFLLIVGLLGVVAEIVSPGAVLPGVVGVIGLILALAGLGQMPTNWAGVALIVASIVMFVLDLKVAGFGLSVGALVAFLLGSVLLFTPFWVPVTEAPGVRLNPWLILGTTLGVAAFFFLGLSAAVRAHRLPVAVGRETLIGKTGVVRKPLRPSGIAHLQGEEWTAVSAGGADIEAGTLVRVVAVDGLSLLVEPVAGLPVGETAGHNAE
jgi:membrane-bound serine protease (ClpP class)